MAVAVFETDQEAVFTARPKERAAARRVTWNARYAGRLAATDAVAVAIAVGGGAWADSVVAGGPMPLAMSWFATGVAMVWFVTISLNGSRARRTLGWGSMEYRRVAQATFTTFAAAVFFAYVTPLGGLQTFLLVAGIGGLGLLLLSRWTWRKWLYSMRRQGEMTQRALLIGSEESVANLAHDLVRNPEAGLRVVGACLPTGRVADRLSGLDVPVSGSIERIVEALAATSADTVIVTSANELTPQQVRRLSWDLEPGRQHLIMAPSLTDISGPRVHTRPVAGLPLLHVETPKFEGGTLVLKRALDVAGAGTLLVLLAPVMIVIAAIVAFTSPGGIIFRQQRVGLKGSTFDMRKFRTMYADAEERLGDLRREASDRDAGNDILFKMKDDPRVTPVGRILRRFSLDELPQLINVFLGEMSLVGPRPPLGREVDQYADHVHRRFLVKPGITGLWQVSGRSNLTWEESVRLDLYYVENWSITGDVAILWKTLRAVTMSEGAY